MHKSISLPTVTPAPFVKLRSGGPGDIVVLALDSRFRGNDDEKRRDFDFKRTS